MSKKEIWKIVLQPDGSWKNVYRDIDESQQLDGYDLAALYSKKTGDANSLIQLQLDVIELALDYSDYEESKLVLEKAMRR